MHPLILKVTSPATGRSHMPRLWPGVLVPPSQLSHVTTSLWKHLAQWPQEPIIFPSQNIASFHFASNFKSMPVHHKLNDGSSSLVSIHSLSSCSDENVNDKRGICQHSLKEGKSGIQRKWGKGEGKMSSVPRDSQFLCVNMPCIQVHVCVGTYYVWVCHVYRCMCV